MSSASSEAITEADLRRAIEGGELVVHYQPKAKLNSGRRWDIGSCEALVRWRHPRSGLLMPGAFLPQVVRHNLMTPLTNAVVRAVLDQMRLWRGAGLDLSVAINLTHSVLGNLDLPDQLSDLVRQRGLDPARVMLEITESEAMADPLHTMDILTRFRVKGFGLSLDDFGTGYSSLLQLHRIPFSEMKIDQSFVAEIGQNGEAETIIEIILLLGQKLGLRLCAEGVETEAALAFLRDRGCDYVQGFLIGRPMPGDQFLAMATQTA